MRHAWSCAASGLLLLGLPAATPAQAVRNTSYVAPSGERVLRQEGDLAAPVDSVWRTLTTSEGLRSFLAPMASIALRVGGHWEANYRADARPGDPDNIVNEIVSYLPDEMLAVRVLQGAPDFPYLEIARRVGTVYQLQPLGTRRTRLVVAMVGWPSGPAADSAYQFFERGNAYTMGELQRRFVVGPRKW